MVCIERSEKFDMGRLLGVFVRRFYSLYIDVHVICVADTGTGPRSEKCLVLGPGLGFPFLMFLYAAVLYCLKVLR